LFNSILFFLKIDPTLFAFRYPRQVFDNYAVKSLHSNFTGFKEPNQIGFEFGRVGLEFGRIQLESGNYGQLINRLDEFKRHKKWVSPQVVVGRLTNNFSKLPK